MKTILKQFIVQEPNFPLIFRRCKATCHFSCCSLVHHVMKHVIDSPNECWGELLPSDKMLTVNQFIESVIEIRTATSDYPVEIYKKLFQNPVFQSLSSKYQDVSSKMMQTGCETCQNHIHISEKNDNAIISQTIKYYNDEKKLIIVADSLVKSGKLNGYRLKTAYRCFPSTQEGSLRKRILQEAERRQKKMRGHVQYLIHDKNIVNAVLDDQERTP